MLLTVLPMYANLDWLEAFLLPVCICVLLPVSIVTLVMMASRHEADRKAEVMLKAIESGQNVPADYFNSNKKTDAPKTLKERLLKRCHAGCVCTGIGIAFLAVGLINQFGQPSKYVGVGGALLLCIGIALLASFFISKHELHDELEAEKNNLISKE